MKEKPTAPKTEEPKNENEITPEKFAALAGVALQLCDLALMCAPAFAEGSQGARTVELARVARPNLAAIVGSWRNVSAKGKENNHGN